MPAFVYVSADKMFVYLLACGSSYLQDEVAGFEAHAVGLAARVHAVQVLQGRELGRGLEQQRLLARLARGCNTHQHVQHD